MKPARQPKPLFLAHGSGNGHGYTTKPLRELPIVADEPEHVQRVREATNLRDEPESIGPAILADYAQVNRRYQTLRHLRDVEQARQTRPLLAAEDRVKDIRRRAKNAHIDLSHEIHIMQRDLEQARLRNRPAPQRVLDRAAKLESTLDGVELTS